MFSTLPSGDKIWKVLGLIALRARGTRENFKPVPSLSAALLFLPREVVLATELSGQE